MMTDRVIIDAGPALTFFAAHRERLLFKAVGPLAFTETVIAELLKKSRQARFAAAGTVWKKIEHNAKLVEVLSEPGDDPIFTRMVQLISGLPFVDRVKTRKDLGEIMVVTHAVLRAEQGADTWVLIDDQDARSLAISAARRLDRLRTRNEAIGSMRLMGTEDVLTYAIENGDISGREAMRRLYTQLRHLDDGLIPIDQTTLLTNELWSKIPIV